LLRLDIFVDQLTPGTYAKNSVDSDCFSYLIRL
jgi:hypothetical protein